MAELPKSIRVGYRDYAVEEWEPIKASASGRWGECDHTDLTIRVRSDLKPTIRAEVLLHEVFHAIYDVGCAHSSDEEKLVAIFGNQMSQVWRDNPDFIAFMSESLDPDPEFPDEQDTIGASVVQLKA